MEEWMLSCTLAFIKLNSWLGWCFMGWAGQSSSFNPKHTSKKSSEWFQHKDINVMKCHEWSPDLALLNICGNSSNGSSMQMTSLLLVSMSFGSKWIWNEENT
jgi:hypothetical protein